MNNLRSIRKQLGLTQQRLAALIGCTQSNIGHYEKRGQVIKPEVADRIIAVANSLGMPITYDDIYGTAKQPTEPVQMVRESQPKASLLFDIFGRQHIVVEGRVFITINYLPQVIDNAGMRSLSAKILGLVNGDE